MTGTTRDSRGWQRPEGQSAAAARPSSARLVDPEDDVPTAAGYAGDFETTAIPRYDTPGSPGGQPGYRGTGGGAGDGLLGDPEPLPYVQPGGRHSGVAEPTEIEPDEPVSDEVRAARRRGTQDLGLMLLRVGLGALLIVHGLQKAFGWWGGQGLAGFHQSLSELGYQHADVLAYAGMAAQIGAGVLLVLGLFTPLAAAAALAVLLNGLLAAVSSATGADRYAFFLPDGHEYQLTLVAVAAALTLTGPGRYGFDAGRGWARRPFLGSALALLVGIGVGVGVWALLNGANPLA